MGEGATARAVPTHRNLPVRAVRQVGIRRKVRRAEASESRRVEGARDMAVGIGLSRPHVHDQVKATLGPGRVELVEGQEAADVVTRAGLGASVADVVQPRLAGEAGLRGEANRRR